MASFERRTRRLEQFQRIERRFQDRTNPLEVFSRDEVKVRYRFYPESIILLLHSIFGQLEAATARSMPLPPMLMLLVSLQFYATGSHFLVVGDIHGVSKSSVSRAVWKTTRAIASLCQTYIKMPEGEEIDQRKKEFFNIARFPQIVGAIDGTQIPIKGPSVNEPDYVNRKGVHSINVQVICDARFRIANIVSKWPGSVHDSRIYRESQVCQEFEQGNIDGILLGDSGYPCRPHLMTPYLNPTTASQTRFNDALVKTRMVIEQTFGILKKRFPCLSYGLRLCPEKACLTVVACAVLHNYGQIQGDVINRTMDVSLDPPDDLQLNPTLAGARYRDMFAAQYFQ